MRGAPKCAANAGLARRRESPRRPPRACGIVRRPRLSGGYFFTGAHPHTTNSRIFWGNDDIFGHTYLGGVSQSPPVIRECCRQGIARGPTSVRGYTGVSISARPRSSLRRPVIWALLRLTTPTFPSKLEKRVWCIYLGALSVFHLVLNIIASAASSAVPEILHDKGAYRGI